MSVDILFQLLYKKEAENMFMLSKNRFSLKIAVLSAVALIAAGAAVFALRERTDRTVEPKPLAGANTTLSVGNIDGAMSVDEQTSTSDAVVAKKSEAVEPKGWETFRYAKGGSSFYFGHPSNWPVVELDDPKSGYVMLYATGDSISAESQDSLGKIYVNAVQNAGYLPITALFNTFDDASRLWFDKFPHEKTMTKNGLSGYFFPDVAGGQSKGETMTAVFLAGREEMVSVMYVWSDGLIPDVKTIQKIIDSIKY